MNATNWLRIGLLSLGLSVAGALVPAAQAQDNNNNNGGNNAQPAQPNDPNARPRGPAAFIDRYQEAVKGLNLTDEQKTKLDAAFEKAKKAAADFQANPPSDGFASFRKVMTDLSETVSGTLTDEQKKTLEEKMPRRGGRGGPGNANMMDRFRQMFEPLGLTDDQKQKVEVLLKDAQDKIQALMKDANGDFASVREKVAPILQDLRPKLEAILTDEQKAKLEKIRQERGAQGGAAGAGGGGAAPAPQPPAEQK